MVALSTVSTPAWAQSSRLEFESLSVIPGLYVEVNGVTAEAEANGLSADSLRADILTILRRSRVTTYSQPEWQVTIGQPALYLTFQLMQPSQRMFVYHVSLEVRQLTRLMRDSTKMVFTRTWTAGDMLGATPATNLSALREQVRSMVRRFVDAYWDATGPPRRRPLEPIEPTHRIRYPADAYR